MAENFPLGPYHVANADGKGWLIVQYANMNKYPPLPQYTNVDVTKLEGGRIYFKILEGKMRGSTASITDSQQNRRYLIRGKAPTRGPASLKFVISAGKLYYGGGRTAAAITHPENPIPTGRYEIELPDDNHPKASHYESSSSYAKTWFRIGYSGNRYLHPGTYTAGCITVTDISKWTEIYKYLILSRGIDGKSVGTIEVVK